MQWLRRKAQGAHLCNKKLLIYITLNLNSTWEGYFPCKRETQPLGWITRILWTTSSDRESLQVHNSWVHEHVLLKSRILKTTRSKVPSQCYLTRQVLNQTHWTPLDLCNSWCNTEWWCLVSNPWKKPLHFRCTNLWVISNPLGLSHSRTQFLLWYHPRKST